MRALNLLHYPSLAREQKLFHRSWSSLAGLLVGGCMAWGWAHWQENQTHVLRQEQSRLQAELQTRTRQGQAAEQGLVQTRLQAEQMLQLNQIAQEQQVWQSLHEGLQTEAQHSGLRLESLQAMAGKMVLQGSLPDVRAVTDVRQRLSEPLQQPLGLSRMTVGPKSQVNFDWEAPWSVGLPSTPSLAKLPKLRP
jgi:hypothetical protein